MCICKLKKYIFFLKGAIKLMDLGFFLLTLWIELICTECDRGTHGIFKMLPETDDRILQYNKSKLSIDKNFYI